MRDTRENGTEEKCLTRETISLAWGNNIVVREMVPVQDWEGLGSYMVTLKKLLIFPKPDDVIPGEQSPPCPHEFSTMELMLTP